MWKSVMTMKKTLNAMVKTVVTTMRQLEMEENGWVEFPEEDRQDPQESHQL